MMDDGPEANAYEAQHVIAVSGDQVDDPVEETDGESEEDRQEDLEEEPENLEKGWVEIPLSYLLMLRWRNFENDLSEKAKMPKVVRLCSTWD